MIGLVEGVGFGVATGVAPGFDPAFVDGAMTEADLLAELVLAELVLEETGPRVPARFAFRFADVFAFFNALDEFEELGLLRFAFRFTVELGFDCGRVVSRPAFVLVFPPGIVNTTSSRFERCSTCAVAPGCSRKETTVLSPLRWAFTSPKPRPRVASALGTSAAGIRT